MPLVHSKIEITDEEITALRDELKTLVVAPGKVRWNAAAIDWDKVNNSNLDNARAVLYQLAIERIPFLKPYRHIRPFHLIDDEKWLKFARFRSMPGAMQLTHKQQCTHCRCDEFYDNHCWIVPTEGWTCYGCRLRGQTCDARDQFFFVTHDDADAIKQVLCTMYRVFVPKPSVATEKEFVHYANKLLEPLGRDFDLRRAVRHPTATIHDLGTLEDSEDRDVETSESDGDEYDDDVGEEDGPEIDGAEKEGGAKEEATELAGEVNTATLGGATAVPQDAWSVGSFVSGVEGYVVDGPFGNGNGAAQPGPSAVMPFAPFHNAPFNSNGPPFPQGNCLGLDLGTFHDPSSMFRAPVAEPFGISNGRPRASVVQGNEWTESQPWSDWAQRGNMRATPAPGIDTDRSVARPPTVAEWGCPSSSGHQNAAPGLGFQTHRHRLYTDSAPSLPLGAPAPTPTQDSPPSRANIEAALQQLRPLLTGAWSASLHVRDDPWVPVQQATSSPPRPPSPFRVAITSYARADVSDQHPYSRPFPGKVSMHPAIAQPGTSTPCTVPQYTSSRYTLARPVTPPTPAHRSATTSSRAKRAAPGTPERIPHIAKRPATESRNA